MSIHPCCVMSNTARKCCSSSGRVRVDFYSEEQQYLESAVLEAGDVILLAFGGHGFEMLEETEIIEVKQGPYAGDRDKTRFEPIARDQIRMRKAD